MFKLILTFLYTLSMCLLFVFFGSYLYYLKKYGGIKNKPQKVELKKRTPIQFLLHMGHLVSFDATHRDLNLFPYTGIYLFLGNQGQGKTYSAVHTALKMNEQYSKSKILSNTPLTCNHTFIDNPDVFYNFNNGSDGTIVLLDEVSAWYNSKLSKNMPPEMFTVVTTNRKNKRIILCTAQSLYMVAKDIRTQVNYLVDCKCLLGALCINIYRVPTFDADGNLVKSRVKNIKIFLQEFDIRSSYDTNAMISFLGKVGFYDRKQ